jgi:hypothetical protein
VITTATIVFAALAAAAWRAARAGLAAARAFLRLAAVAALVGGAAYAEGLLR